jgi:hypothetical protein
VGGQDSYGLFSANRTTGLLFDLVTLTKYRCFQALPTNKALVMAENRAAPPPKIHAIPIAIPLPGLQSNTCPNEPEPYSASLGLNCWQQYFFHFHSEITGVRPISSSLFRALTINFATFFG